MLFEIYETIGNGTNISGIYIIDQGDNHDPQLSRIA